MISQETSFIDHISGHGKQGFNSERRRHWLLLLFIALNATGADVGFVEIESDKGHDSFLLDVPEFLNTLKNYINNSYLKK